MNTLRQYPTDLIEAQWQLLLTLLPKRKWHPGSRGRPPVPLREGFNAIVYVTQTGGQWRMLPKEYGCWQTVYGYFNTWSKKGIWRQIHPALSRRERRRQGRKPTASAGSIDSPSIKTATQGESKGYDAGKKVNGRKRHLLVDTLGLIISAFVSPADGADPDGLKVLLKAYFAAGLTRLRKLWVDGGYRGEAIKAWVASLKRTHKIDLAVVQREGQGFQVMKWRWVVERTFAWLLNFRRLSKDYEVLPRNSEAFIYIAMIHLLVKRIGGKSEF